MHRVHDDSGKEDEVRHHVTIAECITPSRAATERNHHVKEEREKDQQKWEGKSLLRTSVPPRLNKTNMATAKRAMPNTSSRA